MDQHVTREILWNVPVGFVVLLYGLLIPLTAAFIYVGRRWYRIIRLGTADPRPALRSVRATPLHGIPRWRRPGLRGPRELGLDALRDYRRVRRAALSARRSSLQRPGRRGGRFFRFPYYLMGIIKVRL